MYIREIVHIYDRIIKPWFQFGTWILQHHILLYTYT